jgi:hypothetical protein
MIIRTQDGWMINTKTVLETVDEVSSQEFDGIFHCKHVAQQLIEDGADVKEKVDSNTRRINKTTIGLNQIRAILNTEARYSDSRLSRTGNGWYQII